MPPKGSNRFVAPRFSSLVFWFSDSGAGSYMRAWISVPSWLMRWILTKWPRTNGSSYRRRIRWFLMCPAEASVRANRKVAIPPPKIRGVIALAVRLARHAC